MELIALSKTKDVLGSILYQLNNNLVRTYKIVANILNNIRSKIYSRMINSILEISSMTLSTLLKIIFKIMNFLLEEK